MKKLLIPLLLTSLCSIAAPIVFETETPLSKDNRALILELSKSEFVSNFFAGSEGRLANVYELDSDDNEIKSKLLRLNFVKSVASDHSAQLYEIRANPQSEMTANDILFPLQWALQNQGQIISTQRANGGPVEILASSSDIDWRDSIKSVEAALQKTPSVAVLDMGIDFEHPELQGQILKNDIECDNGKVQTGKREDRDNNGLVGDCLGWNFAATSRLYEAYPSDDKGHGTHVSGIIAAKKDNETGISGVSDKIRILPIRVTGRVDETTDRKRIIYRAASRRIAKGIYYAASRGVDVINLSLGWPKSMNTFYMNQAIKFALSRNVLIVAAAGNNNTSADVYPCAFKDVICVGSIDADGSYSRFSNYGGQVDILAPGNQIISTIPSSFIPLKMNIQGYDIMSGTSQAAPYVSAIAALLKASFPSESNDAIKKRLFETAKASIENKSLHGLVQLGKAFKLGDVTSIKPVFKEMNELIVNGQNMKTYIAPLFISNFGKEQKGVIVNLSSKTPGLSFTRKTFSIESIKRSQRIDLPIQVSVSDKNASNQLLFTVEISYEDKSYSYSHGLGLAKSLMTIKDKSVLPFKFVNRERSHRLFSMRRDLPEIDENKYNTDDRFNRLNLRSIPSTYPVDETSYYLSFNPKETEDQVQIFIFEQKDNQIVEKEKYIILDNVKSILSVELMDYNYDGKLDYLVKTIADKSKTQLSIHYNYYDKDLSPLYGETSSFEYIVDKKSVQVDSKSRRFIKTKFQDDFVALPVFMSAGKMPLSDQNLGPWDTADNSIRNRVYSFKIVGNELVLTSLLNDDVNTTLLDKYSSTLLSSLARNDASYEVVSIELQTESDFYLNVVKVNLSFGIGFQRSMIRAAIIEQRLQFSFMKNIRSNLMGSSLHRGFDLTGTEKFSLNSYISFFTNSDVLISHVENDVETKIDYRFNTPDDRLVSFIASYKYNNSAYLFFETIDNILMVKNDGEGSYQSLAPIKKFSFLPGKIMSDLFYPYTVSKKGVKVPGIYIDSSSVSINRLYTMIPENGELHSPIELSVSFPQICGYEDQYCGKKRVSNHFATNFCMPLNPFETKKLNYGYSLLCKYKNVYQIVKIKAKI